MSSNTGQTEFSLVLLSGNSVLFLTINFPNGNFFYNFFVYLVINYNPIYWDTACLIVNSGSLEEGESDDEELDDDGKKKNSSTDYGKIAKAMGDIMSRGIKISLVDINKSGFGFEPDAANNQIMYGLKKIYAASFHANFIN